MSLETVREEIRQIDEEIITLIARRQSLAGTVAHLKHEAGLPIYDEQQRVRVLDRVFNDAVENRIDPVSVKKIFAILIEMNEEKQHECSGEGNLP
jgi:chorismate mutase